jgi:hypothetical protein
MTGELLFDGNCQRRQTKKAKRRRTPGEIQAEILLKPLVITTKRPLLSFRAY